MSIFKKPPTTQAINNTLVDRDENGQITKVTHAPLTKIPRVNWRKLAHDHTNGGMEMLEVLINIARGNPRQMKLPDGQVTEWQVPTIEASRSAAQTVFELIHGKAVAATEVVRASQEADDAEQYRNATEDMLEEAARIYLERSDKRKAQLEGNNATDDSQSDSE